MTELSIVLIAKNQAWNVTRLIDSVLQNASGVSSREIVLVDSASTDETVALAARYPIDILRLQPQQTLSPAAGRYLGYRHTTGKLVLFLDGDMELCPGWLDRALDLLQREPEVAVVTGVVVDLDKTTEPADKPPVFAAAPEAATEVRKIGGAGLYRRPVLEKVGTFNPYLLSDEEPDLAIRIRYAGYRLVRIQQPIAYHYSDPPGTLATKLGRWRRNLYLGAGQNLRYHLGSKMFWPYVKERGYGVLPALAIVAGIVAVFLRVVLGQSIWLFSWLLLFGLIVAGDALRKRSLYRTLVSLLERLFIADGTIRGFFMKPAKPEDFHARFDVIK